MLEPAGRLGRPAILLAGDAAGLTNPVTGAGINAAVISGTLAGEAAARICGGDADAAGTDYAEESADLFSSSLARALARRRELMNLRDGWPIRQTLNDRGSHFLPIGQPDLRCQPMTCLKREVALPSAKGPGNLDYNPFELMQPRAPGAIPMPLKNGGRVKAANVPPEGVYLPNNNRLAPHMRSPDYVQMSTAAAITLGIMPGKMHRCACTRCLNLLLTYPEGCRANCAYCGLARHREAERDYADRNFIRVDWPAVPMAQVVDIVARQGRTRRSTACASP